MVKGKTEQFSRLEIILPASAHCGQQAKEIFRSQAYDGEEGTINTNQSSEMRIGDCYEVNLLVGYFGF